LTHVWIDLGFLRFLVPRLVSGYWFFLILEFEVEEQKCRQVSAVGSAVQLRSDQRLVIADPRTTLLGMQFCSLVFGQRIHGGAPGFFQFARATFLALWAR
jgi:hypothetical protein